MWGADKEYRLHAPVSPIFCPTFKNRSHDVVSETKKRAISTHLLQNPNQLRPRPTQRHGRRFRIEQARRLTYVKAVKPLKANGMVPWSRLLYRLSCLSRRHTANLNEDHSYNARDGMYTRQDSDTP